MSDNFWVSLQIRPMGDFCNIACTYCVYGLAKQPTRMSDDVLAAMTKKVLEHNRDGALFNWHGGEPALAGVEFYEKALRYQQDYKTVGAKVMNQIQTNAIAVTSELADLFYKNEFGIGVSLDGPAFLHNHTRKGKMSQDTYSDVLRGVELLRSYRNTPSVIATVSKHSLPYAKETFHHLISLGFKQIHYSVVFESKPDKSLEVSSEEWYSYLKQVFHEWWDLGDSEIEVREINEVISWVAGSSDPCCTSSGTCAHWFVVDYDGNVYPCEILGRERYYGNILENTFVDIIKTPQHSELVQIAASRPAKCQSCEFLNLCNNGCTNMRRLDGQQNPLGLYAFCEERLNLFEEVQKTFSSV